MDGHIYLSILIILLHVCNSQLCIMGELHKLCGGWLAHTGGCVTKKGMAGDLVAHKNTLILYMVNIPSQFPTVAGWSRRNESLRAQSCTLLDTPICLICFAHGTTILCLHHHLVLDASASVSYFSYTCNNSCIDY